MILLRSCFDLSIELISALVRFNPMGKTPGVLRTRDELDRTVIVGSVMTSSQLGELGRLVACQAARGGVPSSRYAGYAQGRDPTSGWVVRRFQPTPERKNGKGCLFFNFFSKFQTNFEFKSDLNFDDFYSQNKRIFHQPRKIMLRHEMQQSNIYLNM
jgi:hypothetical protein